jgi:hypothetical protein
MRFYSVVFAMFCDFFFVEMVDVKEQRVCIKFSFELGKSAAKTHKLIEQTFGDDSLGQKQTCELFNRFKNGRTSVDHDDRSGRPSVCTTPDLRLSARTVSKRSMTFAMGLS